MPDLSSDCCRALERFCLRAFLVSFGLLLFCGVVMVFAWDWAVGIHGAILGIEEARMEQFSYDAKMLNYLLMGTFKLAAFILFLIPWLVLRFSEK